MQNVKKYFVVFTVAPGFISPPEKIKGDILVATV
jgi:hypothetical protein